MNTSNKDKNIWIPQDVIESAAWLALKKPSSFKVLMRFYMKRQIWNINSNHPRKKKEFLRDKNGDVKITNNGEIEFTYSEAKWRLKITEGTFRDAIDELLEKGFIDIAQSGYGVQREKTLFAISKRYRFYGTPDFQTVERQKRPIGGGFKKRNTYGQNSPKNKTPVIDNS